jgi:putative Mg2+ transporter-C (MgtC) family protein
MELLDYNQIEIILQFILAAVLGGVIGVEREFLKKAAGLRTYVMVCSGCALLTILSYYGFEYIGSDMDYDPSRLAAGILTGIGFIGAGTILKKGDKIEGITTAAGLWVAAAIGIAVGLKLYIIAIFAAVFTFIILITLRPIEFWLNKRTDRSKNID